MAKKDKTGYIGMVKLGPKGQIVIPKEVRDMFGVKPGDSLMLLATPAKGIALQKPNVMLRIADAILGGQGSSPIPEEDPADLAQFAGLVQKAVQEEEKP